MKCQPFYLPWSGKLVTQLPGGITFAYDLRLGHSRDRWKGHTEEYNAEIEEKYLSQIYFSSYPKRCPKKHRLGPQNNPGCFGHEKLPKKLPIWNNCFELVEWWVASDIHLDQSSPLRWKWSLLCWVPPSDEETFVELDSWWATCLDGVVALF